MSDSLRPFYGDVKERVRNSNAVLVGEASPDKVPPQGNGIVLRCTEKLIDSVGKDETINQKLMESFITNVKDQTYKTSSSQNKEIQKQLDTLTSELQALEVIEVTDALATTDSPWSAVVQKIATSDSLTAHVSDNILREHYVEKLLFPLGADIYKEIRVVTSDPLMRQLMFQSIADDVLSHPEALHSAMAQFPLPDNTHSVGEGMQPVLGSLLGVTSKSESRIISESEYSKAIHTTVLRSRLSAEQPVFDIACMEHELETQKQLRDSTLMPFSKEDEEQSTREMQIDIEEMKRIRSHIDALLPSIADETSLASALDAIHKERFRNGIGTDIAPHRLETWVPQQIQLQARLELEVLSKPKEDVYANVLKKADVIERVIRGNVQNSEINSENTTWGSKKYKDHMDWLADPVLQAKRNQKILNIIDLTMTITTLVSGVSGGIQRQIEGEPSKISIQSLKESINTDTPWEVAADLATPKLRKNLAI